MRKKSWNDRKPAVGVFSVPVLHIGLDFTGGDVAIIYSAYN